MHNSNSNNDDIVTLFTEDCESIACVMVTRLKLIHASAFYRGLTSSGMRDAGLLKLTVPDVSVSGLQSVVDYIEADDEHVALPTTLDRLEEVGCSYIM